MEHNLLERTANVALVAIFLAGIVGACAETSGGTADIRPDLESESKEGEAAAELASRIYLASAPSTEAGEVMVDVSYARGASVPGARVAEIRVEHSPTLRFLGAAPGTSLELADKQLTAQEKDGFVRLIIFSPSNANSLDSGSLARLRFNREGEGGARVELSSDRPMLAPGAANEGLVVGAPLEL